MRRPNGQSLGNVLEVRPLTAADLARPLACRRDAVQTLRERHHGIARMLAQGARPAEVASALGCTVFTVRSLACDPSVIELIAEYRAEVDAELAPVIDETNRQMVSIRGSVFSMMIDTLEEHQAQGTRPNLRSLLQLAEFTADRTGYAKRTEVVKFDGDLAAKLDRAISRSSKIIEGRTLPQEERDLPVSPMLAADRPSFPPLRARPAPAPEPRGRASPQLPSLRRAWA
jgi:hypothetical protein